MLGTLVALEVPFQNAQAHTGAFTSVQDIHQRQHVLLVPSSRHWAQPCQYAMWYSEGLASYM